MLRRRSSVLAAFAVITGVAMAAETPPAEKRFDIAEALRPSFVIVEYTLRYDKGEAPRAGFHRATGEGSIEEERPAEAPGYVLSATEVLAHDTRVHPRFVGGIAVRCGKQVVPARPSAYAVGQGAMILKLAEPLKDAKPLVFDAARKPPYFSASHFEDGDQWAVHVTPFSPVAVLTADGRRYLPVAVEGDLIVDADGFPVAACMGREVPADDSWKGSPLKWSLIAADDLAAKLKALESSVATAIFRVTLNFRSPKTAGGGPDEPGYPDDEEDARPERDAVGVLVDANRVLVLASLTPKVTARLQRITLHPAGGEATTARFAHTLRDYGAFIATLEKPLQGPVLFSKDPITSFRDRLLLAADVRVAGDKCTVYYSHERIDGFHLGWKRRVFPYVARGDGQQFLFDPAGPLVALPISRRPKATGERDYYPRRHEKYGATLTPVEHLAAALADPAAHSDPSNVPLTEEEENRLAWLGTELQALDRELARINKVSDLTREGEIGALVSYVYPGSPAAGADIKAGDVLIRIHIEGNPRPIDVRAPESRFGAGQFPWDRYDMLPERLFDRVPAPWPPVENPLSRALTDVGFGRKFTVEFARDGKAMKKDFTVVESPPHYNSAPKYRSDVLGLTVRDLTYEVRRYFQRNADDPGVIASKVELGSKASVAGIKPYEIITHIGGKAVMNVKDFEKLAGEGADLRLSVTRMNKGRVVTIRKDAAPEE